jgi:hypothetical protein
MLDVSQLAEAEWSEVRSNGVEYMRIWYAEAHGVELTHHERDLEAQYWVSPIWNMREKGVALIDSSGQMVKCERRDR